MLAVGLFIVAAMVAPMPVNGGAPPFLGLDKAVHFLLFGIFAFVFFANRFSSRADMNLKISLAAAMIFACAMESFQLLIPERSFSFFDIIFSWLGILSFLFYAKKR